MIAGQYCFVVALLLFLAGIINDMDRAALGVAAPLVQKDLGLSPSALGTVFSTFFLGYALFTFVGGQLADRFGPRRVYAWATALWSVLCAATGAVSGLLPLLIVRLLFGFAEGPMNSATNRTITNWFPRTETSRHRLQLLRPDYWQCACRPGSRAAGVQLRLAHGVLRYRREEKEIIGLS